MNEQQLIEFKKLEQLERLRSEDTPPPPPPPPPPHPAVRDNHYSFSPQIHPVML